MKPARTMLPVKLAIWGVALLAAASAVGDETVRPQASAGRTLALQPVFRIQDATGRSRFLTREDPAFAKLKRQPPNPAFLAVVTNQWPSGLVPVFVVEKSQQIELRRRSLAGEENSSDPLFFALPPEDEPDAARIAGSWECQAVRGPDAKNFMVWELAVEMERISGRFHQGTEYRVAYMAGGTFRSNRLELQVEYLQDKYTLTGHWKDGKLEGQWRRTDDEERGTWEATRETGLPLPRGEVVRLYEWRRATDNAKYYAVEGEKLTADWERSPRPLCRVWRATASGGKE